MIHANQDEQKTVGVVRQLDAILPKDIHIVVVEHPSLLESQFGVVADNYVWTVRYLRSLELEPQDLVNIGKSWPSDVFERLLFDTKKKEWSKGQYEKEVSIQKYPMSLDPDEILEKITSIRENKLLGSLESKGGSLRFSELVDGRKLRSFAEKKNQITVVKFYRRNCPACERLAPSYERFAEEIYKIQSFLAQSAHTDGSLQYDQRRSNRVTDNNIRNAEAFRNLAAVEVDAATDSGFEVKATPSILIITDGKVTEVNISEMRLDVDDPRRFVQRMIRLVDNASTDSN